MCDGGTVHLRHYDLGPPVIAKLPRKLRINRSHHRKVFVLALDCNAKCFQASHGKLCGPRPQKKAHLRSKPARTCSHLKEKWRGPYLKVPDLNGFSKIFKDMKSIFPDVFFGLTIFENLGTAMRLCVGTPKCFFTVHSWFPVKPKVFHTGYALNSNLSSRVLYSMEFETKAACCFLAAESTIFCLSCSDFPKSSLDSCAATTERGDAKVQSFSLLLLSASDGNVVVQEARYVAELQTFPLGQCHDVWV